MHSVQSDVFHKSQFADSLRLRVVLSSVGKGKARDERALKLGMLLIELRPLHSTY